MLNNNKITQNLWKRRKKGINVFVMPVNKAFEEPNEDRRKNGITQRKADL